MPNYIKVTSSSIRYGTKGQTGFECYMSDGSIWWCDDKKENWQKVKPSDEELTEAFKKKQ